MRNKLFLTLLAAVGVINLLPVVGLFSVTQMEAAYGISILTPELELLLRHRALLFGLIGTLVLFSLFKSHLQPAAMLICGISMIGFMVLAWPTDTLRQPLHTVFWVDAVGVCCLLVAVILYQRKP